MKSSILVTGGLGFIGSHTVVDLLQLGHNVVIIDNLVNSNINVLDGIEKISGQRPHFYNEDILNQAALEKILRDHKIEIVIHFAAFKAVGESVAFPLKYYQNNLGGLISLTLAMKACGIKKIVFSSSCTVYGQPDLLPVTEATEITKAESPYGNTKIVGEALLKDISNTGDLQVISLRYFNPVGAHESALIGELPIGVPNNLVPFITQTAAGLRASLTVFGNDYNTTDGTCVRDYIHVVDLASAHVKAMYYLNQSNENFEVFNVGTGKGSTVLEVVQAFEKVAGMALNYQIGPRRPGDVEQIWANCEKANTVLGWTAIRNLETMMADAWRWQQRIGEGE